ncbi:MAG: ABC transporter ATP-binding protein [Candidatus Limnocylindrales bacterium]
MTVALAVHGLRKAYGSRAALDGLDLEVPTGTVYGFLGPNGAGKTTTMRLLVGLIRPDAGTMQVLGQPYSWRDRHRLFQVGALIEAPSFYPFLSGRENLRAVAATGAPVPRGRVEEMLELVGLRERAGDKVGGYSLGMKQRLGIAAALLSDPSLLLLDEPANGLDPGGIVGMRDTLRQLAAAGKTVFVSSHILPEVEQLADVVGIIARGRLVREGRIQDLLASSALIRARVPAAQAVGAQAAAAARFGAGAITVQADGDSAWLAVHTDGSRSGELNQLLAGAGIYASRLEAGSDLESLFLELTGEGTPAGGIGIGGVA